MEVVDTELAAPASAAGTAPTAARVALVHIATPAAVSVPGHAVRAQQSECSCFRTTIVVAGCETLFLKICCSCMKLLSLHAATTRPPRAHLAALRVPGTAAPTDTAQAAAAALMGHALTVQQTAAVASTGRVAQASALVPVPAAVRVVLAHIATAAAVSAPGHAVRAQQSECQAEVLLHELVRLENTTTARLHMPSSHGLSSQHLFSFPRHCMQQLQDHHEYI